MDNVINYLVALNDYIEKTKNIRVFSPPELAKAWEGGGVS